MDGRIQIVAGGSGPLSVSISNHLGAGRNHVTGRHGNRRDGFGLSRALPLRLNSQQSELRAAHNLTNR